MTMTNNAANTYDRVGIREDLSDIISNISPTETPAFSRSGKGSVDNTLFEFQVDSLAAAVSTNAHLEGDDITSFDASDPTTRLGNYTQIARKTVVVSGTAEAVNKAGRKSERAYQLAKRGKEIKRDIETGILENQAAAAGSTSVARKTASLLVHIKTNVDKASNGVIPVYTTIANDTYTNGTQRSFTEDILKNIKQKNWEQGGEASTLMVGAFNKAKASTFAGVAVKTLNTTGAKAMPIVGSADIYVSDFGNIEIIPNRFQRARDAFLIDWEFVSIDYLRPFSTKPLAVTGDASKDMLLVEYGLRVKNEKAHAVAVDLTTSA